MRTYEEFVFELKKALEEVVHLLPTQAAHLFFTLPLCRAHPSVRGLIKSKAQLRLSFANIAIMRVKRVCVCVPACCGRKL